MRLDATDLRYISTDEFRVLTATEIGSKNHEVVPSPLIAEISGLRGGNITKLCGELAKRNLIARVMNARYDGYRLTYGGLDYLALRTFLKRKPPSVTAVGKKIGVGKESDIYLVRDEQQENRVLKLHRLGRISFRAIKSKRDYLGKRSSASWMFMSRLSAEKEFTFMKVLYDHGFPVPTPIDQARHAVVMSLVDGTPLRAVMEVPDVAGLYGELMELIMRFARAGLIHGDFNEFNIIIKRKTYEAIVIDFPQMVSTRHENAQYFFDRDVNCIRRFFHKRFRFEGLSWPVWADVLAEEDEAEGAAKSTGEEGEDTEPSTPRVRLDLEVEASGFGRNLQRQLEDYMNEVGDTPNNEIEGGNEAETDSEEEEDESEDDDEQEEDQAADEPAEAAARLEQLRLHQALGNDGAPEDPPPAPVPLYDEVPEEETDSDADSDDSTGVAATDYTQYVRAPRAPRARVNVSKLGKVDELQQAVAGEMERERRAGSKHHSKNKTATKAGKAKGHKWKSSSSYVMGTDSAW